MCGVRRGFRPGQYNDAAERNIELVRRFTCGASIKFWSACTTCLILRETSSVLLEYRPYVLVKDRPALHAIQRRSVSRVGRMHKLGLGRGIS